MTKPPSTPKHMMVQAQRIQHAGFVGYEKLLRMYVPGFVLAPTNQNLDWRLAWQYRP
jgi:hypothetical protein